MRTFARHLVSILLEDYADEPFELRWNHQGDYVDVIVQGTKIGTLMADPHTEKWSFARVYFRANTHLQGMKFREPEPAARLLWKAYSDGQRPAPRMQHPDARIAA